MGLVQNLYSGKNGCILLFLQFLYQFNISKNFPQFSDCFSLLLKNEFENCRILGDVLLEMGGDPQFCSSSHKHFSSCSVNYCKDPDKIFLYDIEMLEIHSLDLKSAISKIDNLFLKEKLKKVLENKKNSLKLLKEFYFKNKIVQ